MTETDDSITKKVKNQYEKYAYPEPVDDIEQFIAAGNYQLGDPRLFSAALWPEGRPTVALDILVAGCGTNQGAQLAFMNRDSNLTCIDLSQSGIENHNKLKAKHNLTNMTMKLMSLYDVAKLNKTFDLIVCTGVLHHLPDPERGLHALKSVLKPSGKMLLLLYSKSRRAGVYLIQQAFSSLSLTQTEDDVGLARAIYNMIPEHHFARLLTNKLKAIESDSEFVDLFLHPQDRAYSVPEVLKFVNDQGLAFQGWVDPGLYNPDLYYDRVPKILERIQKEKREVQWVFTDNTLLLAPYHIFVVCHKEQFTATQIDVQDAGWRAYFLVRHPMLGNQVGYDSIANAPVRFERSGVNFELRPAEAFVVGQADGTKTIDDICGANEFASLPRADVEAFIRSFVGRMVRCGHLYLSRQKKLDLPKVTRERSGKSEIHAL